MKFFLVFFFFRKLNLKIRQIRERDSSRIIWTRSWKLNFSLQYDKPTLQYKNTKITHQPDFI